MSGMGQTRTSVRSRTTSALASGADIAERVILQICRLLARAYDRRIWLAVAQRLQHPDPYEHYIDKGPRKRWPLRIKAPAVGATTASSALRLQQRNHTAPHRTRMQTLE